MALSKRVSVFVWVWLASTVSTFNLSAGATGGWTHFVQQEVDVNNPNSHGVASLLSASQQQQLVALDEDVSALEDEVSQAINQGHLTPEQASDLRSQLGKIESKQTDILTRGVLSYEDAEGLLVDEQRAKATLKAAEAGRSKPTSSDFYDSKDAFEFRDHLLRKLYYNRINNSLSANEYDELRSHVEHVGQRLDKAGPSGAHDRKLLARMRELESDINKIVNGGSEPEPQTSGSADKKKKKKSASS